MRYIAILITVFNRKNTTLLCLENLYRQSVPDGYAVDVYLTDDGCTDGTAEAVEERFPNVNVIKGNGNLFWNRGMYMAWDRAAKVRDYDYYLWLNDDTCVYGDMLGTLLDLSLSKEDKIIAVGATISRDHTRSTYGGRMEDDTIPQPVGTAVKVHTMNGNIVLIPRPVFRILGNLDYYFTHSKGDFDYGLRALKAGIEIYQAGRYLGECDEHFSLDKWCNPSVPLKERWNSLHRPNGMPPKEIFHLEKRHRGLVIAFFHWCTVYLRCVFPELWKNK